MKRIWAIAVLACLVLLLGCLPWGSVPRLAGFTFGEGSCSAGGETAQASAGPGALSFSGTFAAPTPCHRLKAVLQKIASQHQIVLSIVQEELATPCGQCLALIPYSGWIEGLGPGRWHVRVYHQDRKVLQGEFNVPAAP